MSETWGPVAVLRAARAGALAGVSIIDRHVLTVVADFAGPDGYAWPSIGSVAEVAGCDIKTARRAIHRLVGLGILVDLGPVKVRSGSVTRYRINLENRPSTPPEGPLPIGEPSLKGTPPSEGPLPESPSSTPKFGRRSTQGSTHALLLQGAREDSQEPTRSPAASPGVVGDLGLSPRSIMAEIAKHPQLSELAHEQNLGATILGFAMSKGAKAAWIADAIADAAAKTLDGETPQAKLARVVSFCRHARAPRAEPVDHRTGRPPEPVSLEPYEYQGALRVHPKDPRLIYDRGPEWPPAWDFVAHGAPPAKLPPGSRLRNYDEWLATQDGKTPGRPNCEPA